MARLLTGAEVGIPSVTLEWLHAVGRSPIVLRAPALLFRAWLGLVEFYPLIAAAMEVARAVETGPAGRRRTVAHAWFPEATIR